MDDADVIALLSQIRHGWGNHLQVISGYMELGMPQKAGDYIRRLIGDMAEEKRIFDLLEGDTALYCYGQWMRAGEIGIRLHYRDLNLKSADILRKRDEPYSSLQNMLERLSVQNREELEVHVSLEEDEQGVAMTFCCPQMREDRRLVRLDRE